MAGSTERRFEVRTPDAWENGFNVVVVDPGDGDLGQATTELAARLRIEKQKLIDLLTHPGLPLARVESREQADLLASRLDEFGIETAIVTDESLNATAPPARLKSMSFGEKDLQVHMFGLDESAAVPLDDITVIVRGAIMETRSESVEKRKLFGKKPSRETSTSSDEPVVDIYSRSYPSGWRIPASGFDFSCLGRDKSLTVAENMKTLVSKISRSSPSARIDNDYLKVRSLLEYVWPSDSIRNKDQLSPNRKEISNISTTSNTTQFTKYSRLQRHIYEKEV